ncbi:MAG: amino acid adenylation domain-containing protein [Anaerolineae bacterium]
MDTIDQQPPSPRPVPADQNIEAIYPLTPMQEGMLYHSVYATQPEVYFQQATLRLRGPVDVTALRRAWESILARHPILRSVFVWERLERPLQVVRRTTPLPWQSFDWRGLPDAERQARLEDFLRSDRRVGFHLTQAPLMRLALICFADDDYRLIWSHHHLLLDGWSTAVVLREVFATYAALVAGREPDLAPTRPFRDYVAWLERQPLDAAEAYWRQALAGFSTPTSLQIEHLLDQSAPDNGRSDDNAFGECRARLSAAATANLRAFARRSQVTLNTLLQGAWAILLSRYSGEDDVLFGATVAGRPAELAGVDEMVGIFINTLPARVSVLPNAELLSWLRSLQAQQALAREYEYTPLVLAQGWSEVPRGRFLFETLVVFESYPGNNPGEGEWAGVQVSMDGYFSRTNYPLALTVYPGDELGLELTYALDRFDAASIERLLAHLEVILVGMAADPKARLMDVPLLTEDERRRLLVDWNDTRVDFADDAYIHQLFEAQARQTPDAIALVSPTGLPDALNAVPVARMTYGELDDRANRLAARLRRVGVGPERIVALSIGRSMDMLVAVLAVLKAGGAYLALDPSYPSERVAFMLADAGAHLVITQQCFAAQFANLATVICVDDPLPEVAGNMLTASPPVEPDRLAYVVYTSGSTGGAKGVMVSHRSYANAYRAWERAYGLGTEVRSHLQMANFSFDVFCGDWARALCSGGTLVLCPLDFLLAPDRLYALMRQEAVDCAEFVPVIMRALLPYLEEAGQSLDFMRVLIVASDVWYLSEYWRIHAICGPRTRLINSYGLSEATVDSTYYDGRPAALGPERNVPIGRPFANSRLYILDRALQPTPIGVPGELHVGGVGLARGYLNAPGLTAERFIPDPFADLYHAGSDASGGRLYRTGDLARYLPDGNIELLGRLDDQVKLRGMRVELGEIVVTLSRHPSVLEAEVVLRPLRGGEAALVAYVVPRVQPHDTSPNARARAALSRELRAYLAKLLPAHMVPSRFVVLDNLPLTPSGKVDRRALPEPDSAPGETSHSYVAPRNDVERRLAAIWQGVLHVEPVGVRDSFIELGGHSLLIVRMAAQVQKVFGVRLPLAAVMRAPTIEQLARLIREAASATKEGAEAR